MEGRLYPTDFLFKCTSLSQLIINQMDQAPSTWDRIRDQIQPLWKKISEINIKLSEIPQKLMLAQQIKDYQEYKRLRALKVELQDEHLEIYKQINYCVIKQQGLLTRFQRRRKMLEEYEQEQLCIAAGKQYSEEQLMARHGLDYQSLKEWRAQQKEVGQRAKQGIAKILADYQKDLEKWKIENTQKQQAFTKWL